jgi:hypothetical protein
LQVANFAFSGMIRSAARHGVAPEETPNGAGRYSLRRNKKMENETITVRPGTYGSVNIEKALGAISGGGLISHIQIQKGPFGRSAVQKFVVEIAHGYHGRTHEVLRTLRAAGLSADCSPGLHRFARTAGTNY